MTWSIIARDSTTGQIGIAVAVAHGGRERGARALAGSECGGMIFFQPEHLGAAAEAEAEFGNDR